MAKVNQLLITQLTVVFQNRIYDRYLFCGQTSAVVHRYSFVVLISKNRSNHRTVRPRFEWFRKQFTTGPGDVPRLTEIDEFLKLLRVVRSNAHAGVDITRHCERARHHYSPVCLSSQYPNGLTTADIPRTAPTRRGDPQPCLRSSVGQARRGRSPATRPAEPRRRRPRRRSAQRACGSLPFGATGIRVRPPR